MRQRSTAAALRRRYPLLAFRLWRLWIRGERERDRATLARVREGDPRLRRVTVHGEALAVAVLEFADGRLVHVSDVHRAAATALDAACQRTTILLADAAHPGPVWAFYFRSDPATGGAQGPGGRRALLGRTASLGRPAGGRRVLSYA